MFAGGKRRRSSNIRVMQLFHELKQQFPTVPDHVVTACIASHTRCRSSVEQDSTSEDVRAIREILEASAAIVDENKHQEGEHMGRSASRSTSSSPIITLAPNPAQHERKMNENEDDGGGSSSSSNENEKVVAIGPGSASYSKNSESVSVNASLAKRPTHLDIKPEVPCDFDIVNKNGRSRNIQLSEKCKDVHKLLNSDRVSDKPPRSPSSAKRGATTVKSQDQEVKKKETTSTPTQTTDTLMSPTTGAVNLSLNVNCLMDVVQSPVVTATTTTTTTSSNCPFPSSRRRTSIVQVTPQQPWLQVQDSGVVSPRSYTSVNLTLRPPSVEPQPPIDITSRNSSLTYSTSSFDSQKGLQSRLQITVGPGGGSVASVRTRPRSSYHPEDDVGDVEAPPPLRTGSLNDLVANSEPPAILKQQARIERLRIELKTEKTNLIVMQKEVSELENNRLRSIEQKTDAEIEKQLLKEIRHLRCQCEQLALEVDKCTSGDDQVREEFYQNIYTGQRGPLTLNFPTGRPASTERLQYRGPQSYPDVAEGPKWNCHLCTFLNHPDLDKCEQCEMPRILHVSAAPGDNIHIHVTPRLSRRVVHSWVL